VKNSFPLLPFITYRDRQKNVRRFMDEYTENLARFPKAETIDFIGHSNGTYILASALQRYVTMRVRRVYFGGQCEPHAARRRAGSRPPASQADRRPGRGRALGS
jgi:hypothetical protein